ncbi:MAG: ATP-binding protein [Sarcina sp.]
MKKKIITSTILVILFSLAIITSFSMFISNYNYSEYSKKLLEEYNKTMIYFLDANDSSREDNIEEIKKILLEGEKKKIRVIYKSKEGEILFDSFNKGEKEFNLLKAKLQEENKDFSEENLKNGDSIVVINNENSTSLIYSEDMKYYFYALVVTLIIGSVITSRVINTIIEPIEELQFIASRISKGDFHKRVTIKTNDELGSLGISFNNMADKLEDTMEELVSKQVRLTSILKSIGSGIIALDKKERIILINPHAKEMFKLGVEDLIGKHISDVIEDENILSAIRSRVEKADLIMNKPTEKYVKVKIDQIIEGINRGGTVITIEDITDYKILENMRRDFVANVSHELKTPITSIRGFAETLRAVDDEGIRNKFLGIIEEESDRLTRLIQDILSLYEIENKDNKIPKEIFSPTEILDNIYLIVEGNAKKKSMEISLINESNQELYGNVDRFKQMILNLVDNAIKYAGENSTVWIKVKDVGYKVVIEIEDNGVGMSEEHLNRIFERFYRVDKARSRVSGGTGLGLAIVKHIVNNFEGNIIVASEVSKGTRFKIELPAHNIILSKESYNVLN